jgi:recombination protein RecA
MSVQNVRHPLAFGKKKEEQKAPKVVVEAPTSDVEKFKRLFALSKSLDVKHETTNSLMRLGAKNIVRIPCIGTNLPTFDFDVIQAGGVPQGRVIEIFGPESAGKTSFTLHVIAEAQRQGHIAAFVDAAHAIDLGYAKHLGVNVNDLILNQPDSGEKALQVVEELVDSKCVGIIVVDDVASLVPEAELAGDIGDQHVGLQARMMSQAMRKLTAKCAHNVVPVVFINQIREKIGTMYGNPETTPGGRALKFYSSIRIDVRRQEPIKDGTELVGHSVRLKAVKNKVGTPLRETSVDLYYPNTRFTPGFDHVGDLITFASKRGLFEMSGSWYALNGERLANGLANLKERLRDDEGILSGLRKQIEKVSKADTEVKL